MKTKSTFCNHTIPYFMLLTLIILGFNNMVYAIDGRIEFQGNILDDACTVDTGSTGKIVMLGDVHKAAFGGAGSTAASTRFTIELKDCPDTVTTAGVKFDGPGHVLNAEVLALTAGSTATNVGVAIYESDNSTLIPLATASRSMILEPVEINTLKFMAKYFATSTGGVTAGSANATTDFTIIYN